MLELRKSSLFADRALLVFAQQNLGGRPNMSGVAIIVTSATFTHFSLVAASPARKGLLSVGMVINGEQELKAAQIMKAARSGLMSLRQEKAAKLRETGIVRENWHGASDPLGFAEHLFEEAFPNLDHDERRQAYLAEFDRLGLADFRKSLDQKALRILSYMFCPTAENYAVLAEKSQRSDRLHAFCNRFPVLTELVLMDQHFGGRIAEKDNLVDLLNKRFTQGNALPEKRWSAGHARSLMTAQWPTLYSADVGRLLRLSSAVAHNWVPTTRDEVYAAIPFGFAMDDMVMKGEMGNSVSWRDPFSDLSHPSPEKLLRNVGGRWREAHDRMSRIIEHEFERFPNIGEWLGDAALDLRRRVLVPAIARRVAREIGEGNFTGVIATRILHGTSPSALKLVYQDQDIFQSARLSRKWHRLASFRVGIPRGKGDAWPALTPSFCDSSGSLLVTPLTTVSALIDEGMIGTDSNGLAGLSHCVGTYGPQCRSRLSQIVSIRRLDADGRQIERISTIELRRNQDRLVVEQHRGYDNAEPPDDGKSALSEYLAAIEAGTLDINPDALIETSSGISFAPDADTIQSFCGYEWRDDQLFADEYEFWRPLLPDRFRHFSAEDFAKAYDGGFSADLLRSTRAA